MATFCAALRGASQPADVAQLQRCSFVDTRQSRQPKTACCRIRGSSAVVSESPYECQSYLPQSCLSAILPVSYRGIQRSAEPRTSSKVHIRQCKTPQCGRQTLIFGEDRRFLISRGETSFCLWTLVQRTKAPRPRKERKKQKIIQSIACWKQQKGRRRPKDSNLCAFRHDISIELIRVSLLNHSDRATSKP